MHKDTFSEKKKCDIRLASLYLDISCMCVANFVNFSSVRCNDKIIGFYNVFFYNFFDTINDENKLTNELILLTR